MVGRIVALAAVVIALAHSAAADDKPWAAGVSPDNQKNALALYKEGNALFEDSEYRPALDKYTQALALWKHPAILFNAAQCEFSLDHYVQSDAYLRDAMKYDQAPFDAKTWGQVQHLRKVLDGLVGELEIECAQTSATITVDGKPFVDACPGTATHREATNDAHELVATKEGYKPRHETIKLEPGKTTRLRIQLEPLPNGKLVRRWKKWQPWAVMLGGAAIAGGGGIAYWRSTEQAGEVDQYSRKYCSAGCSYAAIQGADQRHTTDLHIAWAMFAVGGAIAATGFVGILFNQPHLEKLPTVTPSVGADHVGLAISGRL